MLHLVGDDRAHAPGLLRRAFDDQLVVYLKQQPRAQPVRLERAEDAHHRQLHDVRSRSLHGRVERNALRTGADIEIRAADLGDHASSAEQCGDVALRARSLDDLFHIVPHAGILRQIALDIFLGLAAAHADVLRQ